MGPPAGRGRISDQKLLESVNNSDSPCQNETYATFYRLDMTLVSGEK